MYYNHGSLSRAGGLWAVEAKGEPLIASRYSAVGFYVAKYVFFFNDTATTDIYTDSIVGSVRCV